MHVCQSTGWLCWISLCTPTPFSHRFTITGHDGIYDCHCAIQAFKDDVCVHHVTSEVAITVRYLKGAWVACYTRAPQQGGCLFPRWCPQTPPWGGICAVTQVLQFKLHTIRLKTSSHIKHNCKSYADISFFTNMCWQIWPKWQTLQLKTLCMCLSLLVHFSFKQLIFSFVSSQYCLSLLNCSVF